LIKSLPDLASVNFEMQPLHIGSAAAWNVSIQLARLDKIHPLISGNKLYKLYYFLQRAAQNNIPVVKTFGGPYSNHLVATASACNMMQLGAVGFVRGEQPSELSDTLIQCQQLGMQLVFLSRDAYRRQCMLFEESKQHITIPEGGFHPLGAKGAKIISRHPGFEEATHIMTALGTATSFAGLLQGFNGTKTLIGINVLKGESDIQQRLAFLNEGRTYNNYQVKNDYHFGGYARQTPDLFNFMNKLYEETGIATDFVYTAKMMYAAVDLITRGIIPPGSRLVCIHSGGLQGNSGLKPGTLIF
jgi:1-aminocyclopropane-1-carboxylate deaminase